MDDEDVLAEQGRTLSDFFAYAISRFVIAIIQALPLDMADRCCAALAWLFTNLIVIRRKTFAENMRLVFPDASPAQQRAMSTAMWHHLMLMVCEIAWAPRRLHLTNWATHLEVRDHRLMLGRLLSARPTILVTGHYGNFEIGGYGLGLMGFQTVTIARTLDNGYLNDFVQDFRGTHGQWMVDKEGCAPFIDRHLSAGGTLSLLADQHAGSKGCWVDFLGVPASCHKALALFSLTSGAPMLVGYTRRLDRPMRFESGTISVADSQNDTLGVCDDVRTLTKWYCDRLGEAIEFAEEQYWWVHRRWRRKPTKRKSVASHQRQAA